MALNEETLFAGTYTLFFCKDIFFPTEAEYSYISADFRLFI